MSCARRIPQSSQHLVATSSTVLYAWFSDWQPAIGLDKITGVLRNEAVTGSFQSRVALQTATIRADKPDAPTLLEDDYLQGGSKRCTGAIDISSHTAGKFLVRFGVAFSLSAGTTPAQADVYLDLAYNVCGRVVASVAKQLQAPGTANQVMPVTEWIPAIHVDKVEAVIVVTGAPSPFQSRLSYQTATTETESPSSWSTTFDAWHANNGEFNTTELAPTTTGDMWVRFGLLYNLISGADAQAFASVATAIRRSGV